MQNHLPKTLFPFIWHFLRQYKVAVIFSIILPIIAGFWGPFNSILIKEMINLLPAAKEGDVSILILPAILIVLNFIVIDNCTWRGIAYIRAKFVPLIINQIIAQCMDYVLAHSHQFHQDHLSGQTSKQITNLADGVEKLITTVLSNFIRGGSFLITAMVVSYYVNPIFCFTLIVWFLFFSTASLLMSQKLVRLSQVQASSESLVVGELVDCLSNQSNVRIFARKSYENLRMLPFFEQQQKAYMATYWYYLKMQSVQGALIALMIACSCYGLIHLYSKNLITVGDFALILGLSMETGYIIWYTMSEVDEFNKAAGRCKQSLISLIFEQDILDKPDASTLQCERGEIVFDRVQFSYKEGAPLFCDQSIVIPAGEKVGLVGYSGGGKSTFVNLILRLYDISQGAILIDGQNISNVSQDSLRAKIGMIPQDPSLFHRTLMDNIRYGQTEATDEEVISAAKKAHAHEFISHLPLQYDSLVGERGIKLSGGQRQRISIARAMLKNAPILILDEATSQLDSVTENLIQESLWTLMQGKTTLVIAHRLSTLLHMDRIIVFDKGHIVQDGSHKDLVTREGLYKSLWEAQVGGFLPDRKNEDEQSV